MSSTSPLNTEFDFSGAAWRKSRRSGANNNCVELTTGVAWRKSSRSGSNNNCVEVAALAPAVGVRDSKRPAQPPLGFGGEAWSRFATGIKRGQLQ